MACADLAVNSGPVSPPHLPQKLNLAILILILILVSIDESSGNLI